MFFLQNIASQFLFTHTYTTTVARARTMSCQMFHQLYLVNCTLMLTVTCKTNCNVSLRHPLLCSSLPSSVLFRVASLVSTNCHMVRTIGVKNELFIFDVKNDLASFDPKNEHEMTFFQVISPLAVFEFTNHYRAF